MQGPVVCVWFRGQGVGGRDRSNTRKGREPDGVTLGRVGPQPSSGREHFLGVKQSSWEGTSPVPSLDVEL